MRKVIVTEWMSLDGVVQAPGEPDEDLTGGFQHGGWHLGYFDDISMGWVVKNLTEAGGFLFGRRTYEGFAGHWPNASEEEQMVARPLNTLPKYVASTTLTDPLEWENSTVLQGDVAEAVLALKQEEGADLLVIGSTQLVKTLIEHDLVDEYRLMIDPVVLGGGKRLFHDDGALRSLRLVDSQVVIDRRDPRHLRTRLRLGAKALELTGRETDPAFEDTPEVPAVAEPDLGADPFDGAVGRAEQHARPVDAKPMDMVGERLAERVSERATEVVGIERERVGDPGGAQVGLGEVVGDEPRRSHRGQLGPCWVRG